MSRVEGRFESAVRFSWDLFLILGCIIGLFLWAAWQSTGTWVLRRIGFTECVARREAAADTDMRQLLGLPEPGENWDY